MFINLKIMVNYIKQLTHKDLINLVNSTFILIKKVMLNQEFTINKAEFQSRLIMTNLLYKSMQTQILFQTCINLMEMRLWSNSKLITLIITKLFLQIQMVQRCKEGFLIIEKTGIFNTITSYTMITLQPIFIQLIQLFL